jgi:glycosyltransferase involved in cell wall biosynthesis
MFSERLRSPYDEGIKNVAVNLARVLARMHDVMILTMEGADDPTVGIRNVQVNRLLLGGQLRDAVRRFQPDAMIYIPTACATIFSMARARALRHYAHGTCTGLITLQPRPYSAWGRWWVRHLAPDVVWAQSHCTSQALHELGCHTALLPPAVDSARFRPALPQEKAALRVQYGIPPAAIVVTHVGHFTSKRNVTQLLELQATGRYQALVVGSTSTKQDVPLKDDLRRAGVVLMDAYVQRIEDIYRLSDMYLFLAEGPTAAIEVPLSVLEAMACNLPVVSTPFGGLPDWFAPGRGLLYWSAQQDLLQMVQAGFSSPCATRELVARFTWEAAAQTLQIGLGGSDALIPA